MTSGEGTLWADRTRAATLAPCRRGVASGLLLCLRLQRGPASVGAVIVAVAKGRTVEILEAREEFYQTPGHLEG